MGQIKIKNPTESRVDKVAEVFGIEGDVVEYSYDADSITLPNEIVAQYSKTVEDMEGYEELKDIKIHIEVLGREYTLNWTEDHGVVWIVHSIINKLISVPRASGGKSGRTQAQRDLLKAERAKYLAAKKNA